ncbi:MAG: redoxin domain-containing protein [Pirellulales bacterium]
MPFWNSFSRTRFWATALSGSVGLGMTVSSPCSADDQLNKALGYAPRQADVSYEKIAATEFDKCSGKIEKRGGVDGYLVRNPNGQPLRWFADTNGDRNVDQWCYFQNGVEVYRDIDSDFNGVADEYRWLGTAGLRWGVDSNEDGKIDRWKMISAEELTAEIVEAVRTKDPDRFQRLLLSSDDLESLGLGSDKLEQLKDRIKNAGSDFSEFVKSQKMIGKDSRWVSFGASRPGMIPKGTDGSTEDLVVYENAVAVVEDGANKPQQLIVGTLVQVQGSWRLADVPKAGSDSVVAESGIFYPASTRMVSAETNNSNNALQALYNSLDQIDSKMAKAAEAQKSKLHDERADILEKIISASETEEEIGSWVRQFADTIGAAAQTGEFTEGVDRLKRFERAMAASSKLQPFQSYVAFRAITAEYVQNVSAPNSDFAKVQKDYLGQLEKFVADFPKSTDSAEALVQIGLSSELAGETEEASKYYAQAARDYGSTLNGRKAEGATRRLNMVGKKLPLTAKTMDGKNFDLRDYKDQVVIIHCWATWCDPCKADMNKLRELQARFAKSRSLSVVGINVDESQPKAQAFLKEGKFNWTQLWDSGMDSELAVKLGAISLPVTIVVNGQGTVISSTTHFSPDVEKKVEELLTPSKK